MILTVNIGNTHITVAAYAGGVLHFSGKLSAASATSDEYAIRLIHLLTLHHADPQQIEGVILASVVPALTGKVIAALRMLTSVRIMTVGPGLKSGLKLRLDQPAQLGAELLCGVVAAMAEGPAPMAVIFSDTALSIMGVNAQKEMVGGVILPGPQLSMASLVQNTAQLPQVDLSVPPCGVLGSGSVSCMQAGALFGTAAMIDGMLDRYQEALGGGATVVATGRLAPAVLAYMISVALKGRGGCTEASEIGLPVSSTGLILPCGASGRWEKKRDSP